jgi:hypothetical protein
MVRAFMAVESFDALKGHDFTACGKMQTVEQEASGHDFSRAASVTKQMLGFSPCGLFFV